MDTTFQFLPSNLNPQTKQEKKVMPFGPTNAPAAFQHFINEVLGDQMEVSAISYLNNTVLQKTISMFCHFVMFGLLHNTHTWH